MQNYVDNPSDYTRWETEPVRLHTEAEIEKCACKGFPWDDAEWETNVEMFLEGRKNSDVSTVGVEAEDLVSVISGDEDGFYRGEVTGMEQWSQGVLMGGPNPAPTRDLLRFMHAFLRIQGDLHPHDPFYWHALGLKDLPEELWAPQDAMAMNVDEAESRGSPETQLQEEHKIICLAKWISTLDGSQDDDATFEQQQPVVESEQGGI